MRRSHTSPGPRDVHQGGDHLLRDPQPTQVGLTVDDPQLGIGKPLDHVLAVGKGHDVVGVAAVSYTHLTLPTIYSV